MKQPRQDYPGGVFRWETASLPEFISFESVTKQMAEDLKKQYREALPFAGVVALTRSAVIVRDSMRGAIQRVFRNPTPYAVNAPRAMPATKARPAAAVLLRDFGNTPAENYLGPEIDGGARRVKRFERALRIKGILPADKYIRPARGATLDRYGNESTGEIVQVISALQAFAEQGYTANRVQRASTKNKLAKHPKRGLKFFVAKSKRTHEPLGIYKVVSKGKVSPVMVFIRKPTYHQRLDFYGIARHRFDVVMPVQLDRALAEFAK